MELQGVRFNQTNHQLKAAEKVDVEEVSVRPSALTLYAEGVVGKMKGRAAPLESSNLTQMARKSMWQQSI